MVTVVDFTENKVNMPCMTFNNVFSLKLKAFYTYSLITFFGKLNYLTQSYIHLNDLVVTAFVKNLFIIIVVFAKFSNLFFCDMFLMSVSLTFHLRYLSSV